MSEYLLVLNAGSSSLKFRVYERTPAVDWHPAANGQIEGIGNHARFVAKGAGEPALAHLLEIEVDERERCFPRERRKRAASEDRGQCARRSSS